MSNMVSKDILCTNLLSVIARLVELLGNPENDFAFDTSRDPQCAEKCSELHRLQRSLEQYSQRSSQLRYIGFVGHFSAGKSTTINSLLSHNDTGAKRLTGLHPTDKAVTLITHPDNSSSLIGGYRRGDLEVGSSHVNSPALLQHVVVDTPGSGDPTIVDEMVRDFLPICDLLIYTFSAAMPLDKSEIPVLRKAYTELPFIPMRYLVTRADEFRKDADLPLTRDNFDQPRADAFVAEFMSRLAAAIPGIPITPENILLLDNVRGFNVDKLSTFVFGSGGGGDAFSSLHTHKIHYYIRSASGIKRYFVEYTEKKIRALTTLLKTARDNHEQYQQTLTMANSRLTESWSNQHRQLQQKRLANTDWVLVLQDMSTLPSSVRTLDSVANDIKRCQTDIAHWASDTSGHLFRHIVGKLEHAWTKHMSEQENAVIHTTSADTIELTPLRIGLSDLLSLVELKLLPPAPLIGMVADIPHSIASTVHRRARQLEEDCRRMLDAIRERRVIESVEQSVQGSVEQIDTLLTSFFDSVRLYRAGVLAIKTREVAERLGLGQAIDELDRAELSDEQKRAWKTLATDRILPDRLSYLANAEKNFEQITEGLVSVHVRAKAVGDHHPATESSDVVRDVFVSMDPSADPALVEAIRILVVGFNSASESAFAEIRAERNDFIAGRKVGLAKVIDDIRRTSRNRVILGAVFGFAISSLVFVLYYFGTQSVSATLGATVGLGLATNGIGSFLGGLFARMTDKSVVQVHQAEINYVSDSKELLRSLLRQRMAFSTDHLGSAEQKLASIVASRWRGALDVSLERIIHSGITDTYSELRAAVEEFGKWKSRYIAAVRELVDSIAVYYTKRDDNLASLSATSEEIRNAAILPSFLLFEQQGKLLAQRLEELRNIEMSVG